MQVYLVGGAVRDQLLELPVYDRDWVVVGATEKEMLEAGYTRADAEFPVFIHPESGEEYALARREEKTGPGYKGFRIYAGPDVGLEEDLLRRDLTINALAIDASGNLVDVCQGREDLDAGLLRHITPAFSEDPVRLLRIARFAAKLGKWGFRVAHGTQALMRKMAASEDLLNLRQERIWREMQKALSEPQPWRFFEVLQRCGVLERLIPELDRVMERDDSHAAAEQANSLPGLQRVTGLTSDTAIRFAVTFYHAALSVDNTPMLLSRLRAGRQETERLMDLLAISHMKGSDSEPGDLLGLISRLRPERQPERYAAFRLACRALWPERAEHFLAELELARDVSSTVDVKSFMQQGLAGAELGRALRSRRLELLTKRLQEAATDA